MPERKKKILLLSPQPFFIPRGTPINVREIIYSLSEAGYEVTLLAYPFGDTPEIPNLKITRSVGLPFVTSVKAGPSLLKILLDVSFFLKAASHSLTKRFDIIHGIEEGAIIGGFLALILRKPFIVDVDSSMSQQLQESGFVKSKMIIYLFEKLEAFFMLRASRVITVCSSLTEEVKRICPKAKITQIEDFPMDESESDLKHNFDLRKNYNIDEETKILLYSGNLESYQGIELLLKAYQLAYTKENLPKSFICIIGGLKEDIQKYRTLSVDLGIEKSVIFTGILPPANMPGLMAQANFLLSPRLKGSNTPLKIYGYMNSLVPIIATRIHSHTQVLDDSCCYLGGNTPEGFSEAIRTALLDTILENKKRAEAAKALVDLKFSRNRFRAAFRQTYFEILGES